ncbi:glycosyltransferase 87 family protein [Streptomyces sp. NPDC006975]|uniref:glycosyltransferase 87 family protein n=1 Tax=Streptomyces sp. NPDC006975 TaxID=3154310 RepID=UPI0034561F7F
MTRRLVRAVPPAAAWLLTRGFMLWVLTHSGPAALGNGRVAHEVWGLYHHWAHVLAHGAFPAHDTLWQYPPGAGLVMLAPAALPGLTYLQAFVVLTLLADATVAFALARSGAREGGSRLGFWYWTCGLPLLLHLPLARYDVLVTAFAVLALLALPRFPRVGGALAALGALVKVWPVLVLLGTAKGRATRSAWTWAAGVGAVTFALLALVFRNSLSFLGNQGGRGVQIESLGGTLLGLARHAGWHGRVRYQYGAMEYVGPHVTAVADASLALTGVAFAGLLLWRLRARHRTAATSCDAALAAVLLFTVTSRVLSPQYLIWLLGLSAACLTARHTVQRPVTVLIALAAVASIVVYPVLYRDVILGTTTGAVLMLVRNGLLVTAAVWSFVRLWRATRPAPDPAPVPDTRRSPDRALTSAS